MEIVDFNNGFGGMDMCSTNTGRTYNFNIRSCAKRTLFDSKAAGRAWKGWKGCSRWRTNIIWRTRDYFTVARITLGEANGETAWAMLHVSHAANRVQGWKG